MTNLVSTGRGCSRARRMALVISTILCSGLAAPAWGQSASPHPNLDGNGVDLTTGQFNLQLPIASIGSGQAELSLVAYSGQTDNWTGIASRQTSTAGNNTITVEIGPQFDTFSASDGYARSIRGTGATLSFSSGTMIYRTRDGTMIHFGDPVGAGTSAGMCSASSDINCTRLPISISGRSGMTVSFHWGVNANCSIPSNPDDEPTCSYSWRLSGVSNGAGYAITYGFAAATVPFRQNPGPDWYRRTKATLNGAGSSEVVTYGSPSTNVFTITTPGGKTWRITGSGQLITGVRRPSASSDTTTVSYSGYTVTSVTKDGVPTNYNYSVSGNTATMVVTDVRSHQRTIVSDLAKYRPVSDTDALNHTTTFTYNTIGQPTEVTYPEGNKVQFGYDTRGNTTSVTRKAKPGTGLPDIVTTALYPSSCIDASCDQPTWTKDANGNQTDYGYDLTNGLLLTVTAPAAASGVHPKITYTYSTISGVSVVTGISTCATAASCVGTADESKTTIGYDGHFNVSTVTKGAGDGSLSATTSAAYDNFGNVLSVDGPLPGSSDTTTFRYDADRQRVGMISADPDGAGTLKRRAARMTYNVDGQLTMTEVGTVTAIDDAAWGAFSSLQQVTTSYDANARKTGDALTAGGATYSSTLYGYDYDRLDHVTVQMNGSGADRVTKYTYDEVDRPTKVTNAYGTTDQSDDTTVTYTANGRQLTVADANGNITSYGYDGFDRLSTTTYSGGSYEQLGYDANGNVTSRRLRDGTSIGYTYDALNRPITKTLPDTTGINSIAYSYDLLGRQTGALGNGWMSNTFSYDALGRMIADNKYDGGLTYAYDAAGRRTRMTWPDGFYVTYEYDTTGNPTAIKENGSAVLASYGYDDLGRRTSLSRGNGAVTTYGYDAVSRLSGLTLDLAGTANDQAVSFGYNPAGQISSRTASNDSYAWTAAVNADRNYTTNGLNQYTAAGGVSFGYDGRGNLTSSGSTTYAYTSENRLSTIGGNTLAYEPAGGELLQYYLSSGVDTRFITSGGQIVEEINASPWQMTKRYVLGPGSDEPLVEYDASGNKTWLVADERGSIVARTDGSGNVTTINRYDEYGIPASGNAGRFQYTGQAYLPEIGLYYYKARIYSPTLGRFMQTDPIGYGDGLNWYNYTSSDPINGSDASGMCVSNFEVGNSVLTVEWHFANSAGCDLDSGQSQQLGSEGLGLALEKGGSYSGNHSFNPNDINVYGGGKGSSIDVGSADLGGVLNQSAPGRGAATGRGSSPQSGPLTSGYVVAPPCQIPLRRCENLSLPPEPLCPNFSGRELGWDIAKGALGGLAKSAREAEFAVLIGVGVGTVAEPGGGTAAGATAGATVAVSRTATNVLRGAGIGAAKSVLLQCSR